MSVALPEWRVPRVAANWAAAADMFSWAWDYIAVLPPLLHSDNSGPVQYQTQVRVCYDQQALHVRFDCQDDDIWGTYTQRDDPIYDEEVVEVFIGTGQENPVEYAEFEISPNGVLFDAWVHNPHSTRADMTIDLAWDCPDLRWQTERHDVHQHWQAAISIPWVAMGVAGEPGSVWRANFYRIERPRQGPQDEFSCWSPTLVTPADFHKPARFGVLTLG